MDMPPFLISFKNFILSFISNNNIRIGANFFIDPLLQSISFRVNVGILHATWYNVDANACSFLPKCSHDRLLNVPQQDLGFMYSHEFNIRDYGHYQVNFAGSVGGSLIQNQDFTRHQGSLSSVLLSKIDKAVVNSQVQSAVFGAIQDVVGASFSFNDLTWANSKEGDIPAFSKMKDAVSAFVKEKVAECQDNFKKKVIADNKENPWFDALVYLNILNGTSIDFYSNVEHILFDVDADRPVLIVNATPNETFFTSDVINKNSLFLELECAQCGVPGASTLPGGNTFFRDDMLFINRILAVFKERIEDPRLRYTDLAPNADILELIQKHRDSCNSMVERYMSQTLNRGFLSPSNPYYFIDNDIPALPIVQKKATGHADGLLPTIELGSNFAGPLGETIPSILASPTNDAINNANIISQQTQNQKAGIGLGFSALTLNHTLEDVTSALQNVRKAIAPIDAAEFGGDILLILKDAYKLEEQQLSATYFVLAPYNQGDVIEKLYKKWRDRNIKYILLQNNIADFFYKLCVDLLRNQTQYTGHKSLSKQNIIFRINSFNPTNVLYNTINLHVAHDEEDWRPIELRISGELLRYFYVHCHLPYMPKVDTIKFVNLVAALGDQAVDIVNAATNNNIETEKVLKEHPSYQAHILGNCASGFAQVAKQFSDLAPIISRAAHTKTIDKAHTLKAIDTLWSILTPAGLESFYHSDIKAHMREKMGVSPVSLDKTGDGIANEAVKPQQGSLSSRVISFFRKREAAQLASRPLNQRSSASSVASLGVDIVTECPGLSPASSDKSGGDDITDKAREPLAKNQKANPLAFLKCAIDEVLDEQFRGMSPMDHYTSTIEQLSLDFRRRVWKRILIDSPISAIIQLAVDKNYPASCFIRTLYAISLLRPEDDPIFFSLAQGNSLRGPATTYLNIISCKLEHIDYMIIQFFGSKCLANGISYSAPMVESPAEWTGVSNFSPYSAIGIDHSQAPRFGKDNVSEFLITKATEDISGLNVRSQDFFGKHFIPSLANSDPDAHLCWQTILDKNQLGKNRITDLVNDKNSAFSKPAKQQLYKFVENVLHFSNYEDSFQNQEKIFGNTLYQVPAVRQLFFQSIKLLGGFQDRSYLDPKNFITKFARMAPVFITGQNPWAHSTPSFILQSLCLAISKMRGADLPKEFFKILQSTANISRLGDLLQIRNLKLLPHTATKEILFKFFEDLVGDKLSAEFALEKCLQDFAAEIAIVCRSIQNFSIRNGVEQGSIMQAMKESGIENAEGLEDRIIHYINIIQNIQPVVGNTKIDVGLKGLSEFKDIMLSQVGELADFLVTSAQSGLIDSSNFKLFLQTLYEKCEKVTVLPLDFATDKIHQALTTLANPSKWPANPKDDGSTHITVTNKARLEESLNNIFDSLKKSDKLSLYISALNISEVFEHANKFLQDLDYKFYFTVIRPEVKPSMMKLLDTLNCVARWRMPHVEASVSLNFDFPMQGAVLKNLGWRAGYHRAGSIMEYYEFIDNVVDNFFFRFYNGFAILGLYGDISLQLLVDTPFSEWVSFSK